jgi:hypothetical protein
MSSPMGEDVPVAVVDRNRTHHMGQTFQFDLRDRSA